MQDILNSTVFINHSEIVALNTHLPSLLYFVLAIPIRYPLPSTANIPSPGLLNRLIRALLLFTLLFVFIQKYNPNSFVTY